MRKFAESLDLKHMDVYDVLRNRHKHLSLEREKRVRAALGLAALPVKCKRSRSDRTAIPVLRETRDWLEGYKLPSETWDACLQRLAYAYGRTSAVPGYTSDTTFPSGRNWSG